MSLTWFNGLFTCACICILIAGQPTCPSSWHWLPAPHRSNAATSMGHINLGSTFVFRCSIEHVIPREICLESPLLLLRNFSRLKFPCHLVPELTVPPDHHHLFYFPQTDNMQAGWIQQVKLGNYGNQSGCIRFKPGLSWQEFLSQLWTSQREKTQLKG